MIKLRLAVSLLLLLTLPLAQAETLTGRVVRVTDGDTIVVLDASKVQHKIRLTGIDAPEREPSIRYEVQGATCPIRLPASTGLGGGVAVKKELRHAVVAAPFTL